MPRASKTIKRQKVMAGIEYRKGNKEEAYKLWKAADAAQREHYAKKHNNKAAQEESA